MSHPPQPQLEIEYFQISMDAVMRHFVNDFTKTVQGHEWFYDAAKGQVIFKLYVERQEEDESQP